MAPSKQASKSQASSSPAVRLFVRKSALASCLAAARSAYPNEFIGLLEGERGRAPDGLPTITIVRMTVPNGIFVTESQSSFNDWMTPFSENSIGSFHSHPGNSTPRPSRQDLFAFSKEGGIHLIACEPFEMDSVGAFDSRGRKVRFEIV